MSFPNVTYPPPGSSPFPMSYPPGTKKERLKKIKDLRLLVDGVEKKPGPSHFVDEKMTRLQRLRTKAGKSVYGPKGFIPLGR